MGETTGLKVRNNSVLHSDGGNADRGDRAVEIPRISVAGNSTDVSVIQNVTGGVSGWSKQGGWTVQDNVVVQNQNLMRRASMVTFLFPRRFRRLTANTSSCAIWRKRHRSDGRRLSPDQDPPAQLAAMFHVEQADDRHSHLRRRDVDV